MSLLTLRTTAPSLLFTRLAIRMSGEVPVSERTAQDRVPGIRRGCHIHVVPATWEWHPRRIRGARLGPLSCLRQHSSRSSHDT